MLRLALTLATLLSPMVLAGCADAPWAGTYTATGTWKLSGPLEGGRTLGDAAADLLLDQMASAAPVPSFLEEELKDWLGSQLREPVKAAVDAKAPKDLAPGGALTKLLGETLLSVQLDSTITLEGSSDELEGTETVTALEYVIKGQPRRITASELASGASLSAVWAGEESGPGLLSIEPHALTLRYGDLVRRVLGDLVQASELSALDAQLQGALGCQTIVDAMLRGASGVKVTFVLWSYTFSAAELQSICAAAMSVAGSRALGQFALDSHVEVGGGVSWSATGTGGELRSVAGFGGTVNVLPAAIAPKVTVVFTATRQVGK